MPRTSITRVHDPRGFPLPGLTTALAGLSAVLAILTGQLAGWLIGAGLVGAGGAVLVAESVCPGRWSPERDPRLALMGGLLAAWAWLLVDHVVFAVHRAASIRQDFISLMLAMVLAPLVLKEAGDRWAIVGAHRRQVQVSLLTGLATALLFLAVHTAHAAQR